MRHPWIGIEDGTVPTHTLDDPVIPEPARHGEDGQPCQSCDAAAAPPGEREVYRDAHWRAFVAADTAFAGTVMLNAIRHVDGVNGLNAEELASYGPMVAKITQALMDRPQGPVGFGDGRVGRVHSHLWNDGGAHFHQWFFPRPLGYLDLRGSVLVEWEETLPRATPEQIAAAADDLRGRLQP